MKCRDHNKYIVQIASMAYLDNSDVAILAVSGEVVYPMLCVGRAEQAVLVGVDRLEGFRSRAVFFIYVVLHVQVRGRLRCCSVATQKCHFLLSFRHGVIVNTALRFHKHFALVFPRFPHIFTNHFPHFSILILRSSTPLLLFAFRNS